jgi:hypothetical protein
MPESFNDYIYQLIPENEAGYAQHTQKNEP